MRFIFNPDAEEFIPKAEEEHRHSGERYGYSVERGEAGHIVGKQTPRQRGRECRGWGELGRLNPAIGNRSMYRARKWRAYIAIEGRIRKERQKRRRGRTTRLLARVAEREAQARQKEALVAVATYDVRTLAVKGKNGYGHVKGCLLYTSPSPRD